MSFTRVDNNFLFLDVHVYHDSMMPHQSHACKENECSHLCLLASNASYTCACPENMELQPDKHTCLYIEKIYHIILGNTNYLTSVPQQIFGAHRNSFAEDVGHVINRMEFNSQNGEVIIADNQAQKIFTVDMSNQHVFDLVTDHVASVMSMSYGEFDIY